MYKITPKSCRKCGSETSIRWDEGERSSGMDIRPLRPSGMIQTCGTCGFSETVNDLDSENKELADILKNNNL